jgi:hypothetical protein
VYGMHGRYVPEDDHRTVLYAVCSGCVVARQCRLLQHVSGQHVSPDADVAGV